MDLKTALSLASSVDNNAITMVCQGELSFPIIAKDILTKTATLRISNDDLYGCKRQIEHLFHSAALQLLNFTHISSPSGSVDWVYDPLSIPWFCLSALQLRYPMCEAEFIGS